MLGVPQKILQCPVTGESLRPMLADELCSLNSEIHQGNLSRMDGTLLKHEIEGGYINQSGRLAYSVKEGIIVLLSNLAIVLDNGLINLEKERVLSRETGQVQAFYDQIGWQETEEGIYEDTDRFVDSRPVLYIYSSKCNDRIRNYIKKKGKYLVDVACGPIHYDAYRALSDGYDYRICIDVSFQALREAKKQMGSRGIYLMADITNMPLQDESVDDVISLHTLYHVPAEKQATALKEIHRILKPSARGIVIYSWGNHSALMRAALSPVRLLDRLRLWLKKGGQCPRNLEPELYSHGHNYPYIKEQRFNFDMDVVVWSSVSTAFTKTYVPSGLIGRMMLRAIWELEERVPHLAGRFGQYPLFIIKKTDAAPSVINNLSGPDTEREGLSIKELPRYDDDHT